MNKSKSERRVDQAGLGCLLMAADMHSTSRSKRFWLRLVQPESQANDCIVVTHRVRTGHQLVARTPVRPVFRVPVQGAHRVAHRVHKVVHSAAQILCMFVQSNRWHRKSVGSLRGNHTLTSFPGSISCEAAAAATCDKPRLKQNAVQAIMKQALLGIVVRHG
jgi:hypothetical protein